MLYTLLFCSGLILCLYCRAFVFGVCSALSPNINERSISFQIFETLLLQPLPDADVSHRRIEHPRIDWTSYLNVTKKLCLCGKIGSKLEQERQGPRVRGNIAGLMSKLPQL